MAARKRFWNEGIALFPEAAGGPPREPPKSLPDKVTVGHSTSAHLLGKVGRFCPFCRVAITRGACAAHPDVELVAFLTQLPPPPTEET